MALIAAGWGRPVQLLHATARCRGDDLALETPLRAWAEKLRRR